MSGPATRDAPLAPVDPVSEAHRAVVHGLVPLAQRDPSAFYEMALRTRSPEVLDAVAELALPGSRARVLQEVGRLLSEDLDVSQLTGFTPDPARLSELAALSAVQVTHRTPDLAAARGLWRWAAALNEDRLPERHRDLRAQVAWVLGGHRDEVAAWVEQEGALGPQVRPELRADLVNPWLTGRPEAASTTPWQDAVHAILGPRLAPVVVPGGEHAPFDRLNAPASGRGVGDRSVAIILTAYRPGATLRTAVRSIIEQTWQEWRLLVVDDASGPGYDQLLAEVTALDPRITLLRREQNGGTYQARNTGLRAVGNADFVTFHDSDDWSHPQRLELSLEPLVGDPATVASTAWGLKATDDLGLTRLGYRGVSRVAAGLVLRRDPVLTDLGFFDPVRKSADKEFQRRISVAFPDRTAEVRDPTAVIRRGHESLSSADHSRGWRHHSRRHYFHAYQPWHRQIRRGQTTPFLDDTGERRFWAPPRWLDAPPTTGGTDPRPYDVVLATDYADTEAEERVRGAIAQARRGGRRVGLLHLDRALLHSNPEPPTTGSVVRLVNDGQVAWVYLDDDLAVDRLLVLDASVLHPGPDQHAAWTPRQVAVAVPPPPTPLDRAAVLRRARSVFGTTAQWWDPADGSLPAPAEDTPEAALTQADT